MPIECFANSTIRSTFSRFWEISDITEFFCYTERQYEEGLIDKIFFENLFTLKKLVFKMNDDSPSILGQISSSTIIDGNKIRTFIEHDVKEETSYD